MACQYSCGISSPRPKARVLGGCLPTTKERPRGENVVDLMDALRKSIGGGGGAAPPEPSKKSANEAKKATPGQKEMLMPIAGKKQAKEAAAKKPAVRPQRKSA
jgi:DNA end-binding protein Ku